MMYRTLVMFDSKTEGKRHLTLTTIKYKYKFGLVERGLQIVQGR